MGIRELIKNEEVNNKTYCLFIELGNNTGCPWDLTIGEWYWSNNLSKMYYCLRDVIVGEAIKNYFELKTKYEWTDEEINLENKDGIFLARHAALSLDDEEKDKKEILRKIATRLMRSRKSFEALNNMILDICDMLKRIDIPMNITFVKGFGNCIPMLTAHDAYDPNQTEKEMLEKDIYC